MYPQVYTSRVDRRRAKTNVHTLVVNPSMILTSTLVPGVHWMIRFNSVSFRDSRPSFQSMDDMDIRVRSVPSIRTYDYEYR